MSFHVYRSKDGTKLTPYHSCETLKLHQDCVDWTLANAQDIEDNCDSEVWFLDVDKLSIIKIELNKTYSVHVINP